MNVPPPEPTRKATASFDRNIAQFLMDRGPHDRLGEDVKEVGPHGQDALDAGGHQGRGDDEPAAGADAAGDQTGAKPMAMETRKMVVV